MHTMKFVVTLADGTQRQIDIPADAVVKVQQGLHQADQAAQEIAKAVGVETGIHADGTSVEFVVGPRTLRSQVTPHVGNVLIRVGEVNGG